MSYLKIFFLALLSACGVIPIYLAISFSGTCLNSHFSLFKTFSYLWSAVNVFLLLSQFYA